MGNSENTKFTRDVWIVEGVDDLESTIFAYCSSKETAEKAKSIVESNGFEDMVKITYSELPMDMIFSGGKMIYLKEKEEMSQTTKAISGKECIRKRPDGRKRDPDSEAGNLNSDPTPEG